MNTPADKPDLPAPSKIVELIQKTIAKSGHPLTEAQAILLIGALAVWIPAIRADERRKARAELIAELKPVAYLMREDIDELRKTGRRAAVIYSESISPLDVPLAIIPDTKE